MEMADGIVINKADGDNIPKAEIARSHFKNALHLFPLPESGWSPKVLTYSGYYELGIKEIWEMIDDYIDFVRKNGYFDFKRNSQSKYWLYESINEQIKNRFYSDTRVKEHLLELEQQVLASQKTSFIAAKEILDIYFGK